MLTSTLSLLICVATCCVVHKGGREGARGGGREGGGMGRQGEREEWFHETTGCEVAAPGAHHVMCDYTCDVRLTGVPH